MLNGSQVTDIQARLRQELRGRTESYSWTNEDAKAGNASGVEATIGADIAREGTEKEKGMEIHYLVMASDLEKSRDQRSL
jgi:hypothetical protein